MEYQREEEDSLASISVKEDPFNWSPEIITEQTAAMFKLKEMICDKATANIKRSQVKDQFYYNKKHPDNEALTEFLQSTSSSAKPRRSKISHIVINLFCTCRMPESFDSKMIKCDWCTDCFHFKCVHLKKNTTMANWMCTRCSLST